MFPTFFFFNDPATTEIYTLSLHDALPILPESHLLDAGAVNRNSATLDEAVKALAIALKQRLRSEEHTSELQSHVNLVCRLLLEKKNTIQLLQPDEQVDYSLHRLQRRLLLK